jgi:hypothetical protein
MAQVWFYMAEDRLEVGRRLRSAHNTQCIHCKEIGMLKIPVRTFIGIGQTSCLMISSIDAGDTIELQLV